MAQAIPMGYGSQCQGGAGVRGFSRSGKPRLLLLSLIPVGWSFPTRPSFFFVECHYAKFLWRAIHLVLGIPPLVNIELLFNNWSKQGGHKHNILLLTGAAAICWSIWLTRNDTVFNNCKPKTFLQVLFRGTYWLRSWALLRHTDDQREQLVEACQLLESSTLQLFASHGWPSILRIGL